MIDAIGQEIQVGDYVAFRPASSNKLILGKVAKLTPKGASIAGIKECKYPTARTPDWFVKITEQYQHFKDTQPEDFI